MAVLSVVVVPARDEQEQIRGCIEALAAQTVSLEDFEVILVVDACRDHTESAARETADKAGLHLTVVQGPGQGTGPARSIGMDAAAARLESLGAADGLIATTDADTRPARDWLARQLEHQRQGAFVIAGLIEFDTDDIGLLPIGVRRRRELDAHRRKQAVALLDPAASHHHFAGASLGVTATTYRRVGGMEPTTALEDEAFAERLLRLGVPVLRPSDVRVRTSARTHGRAQRGLSVDLAVSSWLDRRRYRVEDFDPGGLRALKCSTTVSVIVPTKNCGETIADVIRVTVRPLREAGFVDEVIVIDAGSSDGTTSRAAAAGATVLQQDEVLSEFGPALGKGDAMWRALHESTGEISCFMDGDTVDPDPRHLFGLLGPLLTDPTIDMVKGSFERPFRSGEMVLANEGGRVTELMARPLVNLHFPLLAGFGQPLAGEFAARRRLLEELPFPAGYGIEIALLIDTLRKRGLEALAECHLGSRQNRHQSLRSLGEMAFAVLAATERRLSAPRSATGGQYLRPWDDGSVGRVPILERPPLRELRLSTGEWPVIASERLNQNETAGT